MDEFLVRQGARPQRPDPSGKWGARLSAVDKVMAMESLKQKHRDVEAGAAAILGNVLERERRASGRSDLNPYTEGSPATNTCLEVANPRISA